MTAWAFEGVEARLGGRRVLDGVSLRIDGGFTAVCGANGAGKTTLLRCGLGVGRPAAGRARLGAEDVLDLSPAERSRRVGYLPQERRVAWGVPALRLAELGATPLHAVVSAGGGARNATYTRIRERRLKVPVSQAREDEACYGSARLACHGTDLFPGGGDA